MNALAALLLLIVPAEQADAEARARLCILRARHNTAAPQNPASRPLSAKQQPSLGKRASCCTDLEQRAISYPPRSQSGRRWTGCPDWRHLTTGAHAGQFDATWLRSLDANQVQALHADAHEGRVQWQYVTRPARRPVALNSCPGGQCPAPTYTRRVVRRY